VSVSVLIADDQAVVRAGIAAVEATRRLRPHVVLMDIRMPRLDGLAATRRLLDEGEDPPSVLILTTFGLDEYVYEALRAGASDSCSRTRPLRSCSTRCAS
jgi:DNA-binding NarL/FixJ family response regulator